MGVDDRLPEWVRDALAPLGDVTMRPMMGVATLYLDGTIFAVADDGDLWLKADDETNIVWDEAGCERFSFTSRDGRVETINYRRAPLDAYDDPEVLQHWARLAHGAGLRGASKRKPKRKRRGTRTSDQ